MPKVQEVEGSAEDVLGKLEEVSNEQGGFGKWVVRHPLRVGWWLYELVVNFSSSRRLVLGPILLMTAS